MWLLLGMAILLGRAVHADRNDENYYYLSETNEDRSLDNLEEIPENPSELGVTETTKLKDDDQRKSDNGFSYSMLKSDTKRSIAHLDLHDGTLGHRQVPAPLATLLYWPHRDDEVIGMEERRNPLSQARRNPSFSPWGGKRNVEERYKTITKIRRPPRVPFNSWGGKRNDQRFRYGLADLKRTKLSNWEGKKSPPFNSWGGKRVTIEPDSRYEGSVTPLHTFENKEHRGLRKSHQLGNIGGDHHDTDKMSENESEVKRGSSKLIGNSDITTSGSTMDETLPRVPFEPWGGKREELRFNDDGERSARVSLIFRNIRRFIPWTEKILGREVARGDSIASIVT